MSAEPCRRLGYSRPAVFRSVRAQRIIEVNRPHEVVGFGRMMTGWISMLYSNQDDSLAPCNDIKRPGGSRGVTLFTIPPENSPTICQQRRSHRTLLLSGLALPLTPLTSSWGVIFQAHGRWFHGISMHVVVQKGSSQRRLLAESEVGAHT